MMTQRSGSPSSLPHVLTTEQLRQLFAPLQADYCATVALTADLPLADRRGAIVSRLEAYGEALGDALGAAVEEATVRILGPRALGGER